MLKPVEVKALPKYKLWVRYSDGAQGEVDLSHLAGKGVFSIWNDAKVFERVRIGESGEFVWNENVDLCPDSIYLQMTGKSAEQMFPDLRQIHA